MPNWAVGDLKIRGKKDVIISFMQAEIHAYDYSGKRTSREIEEDFENYFSISTNPKKGLLWIDALGRCMLSETHIWFEFFNERAGGKEILVLADVQFAWDIDVSKLLLASKAYDLDFHIYAFERGMQFNRNVEIISGEIVKNEEIKFNNYEWDCICPSKGG